MAKSLASPFIEVYKAAQTEITYFTSTSKSSLKQSTEVNTTPSPCNDIFEAVKSSSIDEVKRFVALVGPDMLDENGHTVAHWAAILGLNDILLYLIESGVSISVCSRHEMGQYPIHWACVNNHQYTVNLLLEHGAHIEQIDSQGATPLIVAARYGSLAASAFLLARGANIAARDNDGDTALHLAAYGGFADLCRVLVYSGLSPHLLDEFGQSALHMACIGGDLRTVKDLCRVDKVAIDVYDGKGKLPVDLAHGRNFIDIENLLNHEQVSRMGKLKKLNLQEMAYGPSGTRWPLFFFIFMLLFWGYPMYVIKAVLLTWVSHWWIHYIFLVANVIMWLSFYHCSGVDPGYLPRNTKDYDEILKQVSRMAQDQVPLDRLCHTCRTLKPVRSSHCRFCNRCIRNFDHHCPYVDNCIGVNNRHSFLIFISAVFVSGICAISLCYTVWRREQFCFRWDYIVGMGLLHLFAVLVTYVTLSVWLNALSNITSGERLRWRRYRYLRNAHGEFKNSLNKGYLLNLFEFFHCPRPKAFGSDPQTELKNVLSC